MEHLSFLEEMVLAEPLLLPGLPLEHMVRTTICRGKSIAHIGSQRRLVHTTDGHTMASEESMGRMTNSYSYSSCPLRLC